MSDEKTLERALALVQTLHSRTRDGKIEWLETHNVDAFETELGDFRLLIQHTFDPEYPDQPDYALTVFNKDSGREIETISPVTLRPVMDRTTVEGLNPYVVLQQTYEMARRKALHVDDALESILQSLKEH